AGSRWPEENSILLARKARTTEDVMFLCFSTVCGKPVHPVVEVQRILGGKSARRGNFPWQALTGINGRGGGALLGDRWILTAAHTIFPKGGVWNNVNELHKMGNHPVRRIFIHPDFNPKDEHNFNGDIALLELKTPVTLGPTLLPICLPDVTNTSFYAHGHIGYVSGFGVDKNRISSDLKYVSLPAVAREKCQSWLDSNKKGIPMVFSENMFCAGFLEGKQDTCQGDSGSVFTVLDRESGRWVATGIVSWGIGCATGYGFYTKILNYVDWINGIIKEDSLLLYSLLWEGCREKTSLKDGVVSAEYSVHKPIGISEIL
uniref:Peptidase S1 domain-containing protein n=1 Tax=Zosterops lateralis melanops TaxID=1220523 RepID=A0A8D2P9S8_ZOSLA